MWLGEKISFGPHHVDLQKKRPEGEILFSNPLHPCIAIKCFSTSQVPLCSCERHCWCAEDSSAPTAARPSSPGESVQPFCSGAVLQSHPADVCTALGGSVCHTFIQCRVTSCWFRIHMEMDECRVWVPLSRAFRVQLQALEVHRAPVFHFLGYLYPLLILYMKWVSFFSIPVTNKGFLGDRVMEFICFSEMWCLLPIQSLGAVNVKI